MKYLATLLLAGVVTLASTSTATAQRRSYRTNKVFGLGVMLGAPSGLSGKYFMASDFALDFGVGVYHRFGHREGIHLHADVLWHPVNLVSAAPFDLPLYFGIGGRFWSHDRYRDDYNDHSHLGVRAPLGIAFDFKRVPLDVFAEVALVIDILADDGHGYSDFNGAIGIRYWF